MKRFEYHVLDLPATDLWVGKVNAQELTDKLNELGWEGWELTSSVDLNMTQGASVSVLIMLKRELQ